ncbi:inosine-5-monophosphate dehydrogenase [Luteitalea sp. TBR-22]|uniref:CBS domain-containing protein n=1 Tax=Luteitalea sp. TBR-22 TaxID=2802971 RepID=UPI001AFB7747|nr:CBS domain-containing protein [Luteitalea sp. TBR-22]BCS32452.1 inosine-5-monophosphate dehydrogenase [Luteitalea sp. TBR-22]
MTTLVRHMLANKSDVHTVDPDDTVLEALRVMADHNIGAVLVMSGGALAGILSERDYARKMVLHGKASRDTLVREVMTGAVVSVTPDWTCDQCMALMTERHVRHLPVVEEGRVTGVVSIGDVVRAVVREHEFTINHLEHYIMSGG